MSSMLIWRNDECRRPKKKNKMNKSPRCCSRSLSLINVSFSLPPFPFEARDCSVLIGAFLHIRSRSRCPRASLHEDWGSGPSIRATSSSRNTLMKQICIHTRHEWASLRYNKTDFAVHRNLDEIGLVSDHQSSHSRIHSIYIFLKQSPFLWLWHYGWSNRKRTF